MENAIDQQIKQTEMNAEQIKSRLDDFKESFIRIVKPFVVTYYRKEAESWVRNKPALTQQLGTAGLAPIKKKIEELIKRSESNVEALFSRAEFWPHLNQPMPNPYEMYSEMKPDPIQALRKALWPVFPILGEAGLVDKDFLKMGTGQQYYPYALPDFPQFEQTRKNYREIYEAYFQTLQQLQALQKQKAAQEAKSLWDNA
jgi:hypothetical protein